jgi:phosphatidylserine/phosphatidylglycerophosphate/cardiolipin synthase-like enzyme
MWGFRSAFSASTIHAALRLTWRVTAITVATLLAGGCASQPQAPEPEFLAPAPAAANPGQPNRLVYTTKVGWHLVRSQVLEPLNRPVSYISRLALLLGRTAADASREVTLRAVRLPVLASTLERNAPPPLKHGAGMDLEAWEDQLDALVGGHRSFGKVELLIDGDEYFPALEDAIAGAEDSIKMRTYIFDTDDVALDIADRLKARSADVDVDVMFDGLGTRFAEQVVTEDEPALVKPATMAGYLRRDSDVEVRDLTNPWFTGDHTKTTLIDDEVAFIGGMNVGREYRYDWHDVMVRAEGTIVGDLAYEFDKKWAHSGMLGELRLLGKLLKQRLRGNEPDDGYAMRAVMTRPYASDLYRAQLAAIRNAQGYIYIQNSYFSDAAILHALIEARLRGVDVRVIMSLDSNHGIMNQANVIAANALLRAGARVYNYRGMSHVKAAIYDGWSVIGSANFDRLSFRVNLEMNLASSAPEFTNQVLERIFFADFDASDELHEALPQTWRHRVASIVASQL